MIVRHRSPFAMDRTFDRTFEQLTSSLFDARRRLPEVEASWDDDVLVLTVDLPGVPADSVTVDVSGRLLTLGAHTDQLDWSRQLQLGSGLDPDKVTARHLDGRLTVRIGSMDAPAARSIAIDTSPEPASISTGETADQSIEATSTEDQPAG